MNQPKKIENLFDLLNLIINRKLEFFFTSIFIFFIIFSLNFFQKNNIIQENFEISIFGDDFENQVFEFELFESEDKNQKFFNFNKFTNDKEKFLEIEKLEKDLNIQTDIYTQKKYSIYEILNQNMGLQIFDLLFENNSILKLDIIESNNLFIEKFFISLENSITEEKLSEELKEYINNFHNSYIQQIIRRKYENYHKFQNYLTYNFSKFKTDLISKMRDYTSILITQEGVLIEKIKDKDNLFTEPEKNKLILKLQDIQKTISDHKLTFLEMEDNDFCLMIKQYFEAERPIDKIEYINNRTKCNNFKVRLNIVQKLKDEVIDLQTENFVRDDFNVFVKRIKNQNINIFNIISYLVISIFISILFVLLKELFKFIRPL